MSTSGSLARDNQKHQDGGNGNNNVMATVPSFAHLRTTDDGTETPDMDADVDVDVQVVTPQMPSLTPEQIDYMTRVHGQTFYAAFAQYPQQSQSAWGHHHHNSHDGTTTGQEIPAAPPVAAAAAVTPCCHCRRHVGNDDNNDDDVVPLVPFKAPSMWLPVAKAAATKCARAVACVARCALAGAALVGRLALMVPRPLACFAVATVGVAHVMPGKTHSVGTLSGLAAAWRLSAALCPATIAANVLLMTGSSLVAKGMSRYPLAACLFDIIADFAIIRAITEFATVALRCESAVPAATHVTTLCAYREGFSMGITAMGHAAFTASVMWRMWSALHPYSDVPTKRCARRHHHHHDHSAPTSH